MTEIPEHLLKRSKERRSAIGGGEGASEDAPAAAPSGDAPAAAPAPVAAAAAATPEPAAPKPVLVRPEVVAAQGRRKIPWWAMSVLAFLPLWAYVFQATLEPPPAPSDTPFALGEEIYSARCASCHGAGGGGGAGPALADVTTVWPDYRDQIAWVKLGSSDWPGSTYGATDVPKAGGMPAHADLTDAQLAEVVLYERVAFGGVDPLSEEALELEAIARGEDGATVEGAGLGPESAEAGIEPAELAAG